MHPTATHFAKMVPMANLKVKVEGVEVDGEIVPVSPTGQYFNSSVLSVAIMIVFEFDAPIDESTLTMMLEDVLLSISPRFSSVMVRDEQGIQCWKKVKVNIEDHVNIPTFPSGLVVYDDCVRDYIISLTKCQLPQIRPLWDAHIINYPTRDAAGMAVLRIHHSLGDGYSLMAALFSCIKRADNPSLPLTFPSSRRPKCKRVEGVAGIFSRTRSALSLCLNTVRDFGWSVLKSNLVEDDRSPIRSGVDSVKLRPTTLSTVEFSLDDIHKVKTKIRGTVNDVICGIIFYGTRLYIEAVASEERTAATEANVAAAEVTALVLLNTRVISNYQPLDELTKLGTKSPWGNHFAFIHVGVPHCKDPKNAKPLGFVRRSRRIMEEKKNSYAVVLTGKMLEIIRKVKGPEVTAKYLHTTLKHTSMAITNVVGPIEQMILADRPVKNFYYTVLGSPQSLTIAVVSYMGKVKLTMATDKDVIDSKLLTTCMLNSFDKIFEAAIDMNP